MSVFVCGPRLGSWNRRRLILISKNEYEEGGERAGIGKT